MSDLRLIILLLGLLFIAAVLYWEMRRIKKEQQENLDLDALGPVDFSEDNVNDLADLSDIKFTLAEEFDEIDPLEPEAAENKLDPLPGDLFAQQPRQQSAIQIPIPEDDAPPEPDDSKLMTLLVTAEREHFPAAPLFSLLDSLGCRYGDMRIYHRYGSAGFITDKPLFSVANMHEPGFFEPELADTQGIKGLVLFFSASSNADNRLIFDLMLDLARQIAQALDGTVLDGRHKVLTDNAIQQIYTQLDQLQSG